MSISALMTAKIYCQDDNVVELSRLVDYLNLARGTTFTEGELANQVNMVFHDEHSIADAGTKNYNFHDGTLTNKVGISITMDKLKALFIKNKSTEADIEIGNGGANSIALFGAVAHVLNLPPGGVFIFISPDLNGVDISVNADLLLTHDGTGSDPAVIEIVAMGVDNA